MTVTGNPGKGHGGPFDTEEQARAAAHAVIAPEGGRSILTFTQNRELLARALEAAGVGTGAYDDRIAGWMGQWTDATCAVVAGWVTRAAAGKPDTAGNGPRCNTCGGPAEQRPDPYADRMLWRHAGLPRKVTEFLDAEHEAMPADAPELFAGTEAPMGGDR